VLWTLYLTGKYVLKPYLRMLCYLRYDGAIWIPLYLSSVHSSTQDNPSAKSETKTTTPNGLLNAEDGYTVEQLID